MVPHSLTQNVIVPDISFVKFKNHDASTKKKSRSPSNEDHIFQEDSQLGMWKTSEKKKKNGQMTAGT